MITNYVFFCSKKLSTELRSERSLLAQIDATEQTTIQRTPQEKVNSAAKEFAKMVSCEGSKIS